MRWTLTVHPRGLIARAINVVDFQCHVATQVHRASQFACSSLPYLWWQGQAGTHVHLYLWASHGRDHFGSLWVFDAFLFERVTTAAKARATFYFNSLWQGSIWQSSILQVRCMSLVVIVGIWTTAERNFVPFRLLALYVALLIAISTSLWSCTIVTLTHHVAYVAFSDSMAWMTA